MSPKKEGFSFRPEAKTAVGVGGVGLDEESKLDVEWAFFEGKRLIAIDLDRCLRCLMESGSQVGGHLLFFFSSQRIGDTSRFILASSSSLQDEEDREDEED